MRINYHLGLAITTLVMTNCSHEDEFQDLQSDIIHTLTASIEGNSRSAVTDGGLFSWTINDSISVWDEYDYQTYTYSGIGNKFTGSATQIAGYAIYPKGNHPKFSEGSLPIVNMKSSYSYDSSCSTNAIMLAKVEKGNNDFLFSHLGGLMRFTIKDIPANATSFTFTANTGITGDFQVTQENGVNVIKTAAETSNNKTVTITYPKGTSERTFYVPLPVGKYDGFTIAIGDKQYVSQATNTIKRKSLLLMPTFICSNDQLVKGSNTYKMENTEQEMNINGNETLLIETPDESNIEAKLKLNYTPGNNDATLNISDGQIGVPTDSKASIEVNVSNSKATLNIDAPTLTVTLASGTYKSVKAKTASQTLYIKNGVTVDELICLGGAVIIENGAKVTNRSTLRVLTFEDKDVKFQPYYLEYANGWSGKEITKWSDLIDNPQYSGPLMYGNDAMDAMYYWYDEDNTQLYHMFPDNYAYCFWGGGHAISNYWGAGYADENRNKHIAQYYGQDYVDQWAGKPGADGALGWFLLQLMTPIPPHSGNNFAVHYGYKDFFSYIENLPEISFYDCEPRIIDHMYVTNTNYTLNQLYNGVKSEEGNSFGGDWNGLTNDAWLKIVAYGFESVDDDEPMTETEFFLVKGYNVVEDWQKWDLSSLGKVAKVRFNFLYSEEMGGKYGFTIPGYFAYDDIGVLFEEQ